jgi:site-specific DNA-methyltransferase (adenine-specific)
MGIDGPYHKIARGFMGQTWDGGDIAFKTEIWKEVFRVLKPGSVLLAFAATRNYHRLAVAIEDSGFEIFDMINWIYGSGFPKRKNLLKPAHEPIVVARKGVNKELNLDECRVPSIDIDNTNQNEKGRYPANVIHDGLEEDWSKYFYCSKASKKEKEDTTHPSVKPINLIRYLIKLVTRKKGTVLDPFAGTGTTGEAAILEGRKYYLIEKNKKYFKDIKNRVGKFNELFI